MIEITFQEFLDQRYVDEGFELYLVKNNVGDPLYIGITGQDVWSRWFGWNGHIAWDGQRMQGQSAVGQKIEDHLPESLSWKIQLWTAEDCVNFLQEDLPANPRALDIRLLEPHMIRKLHPILNVSDNQTPGLDTTSKSSKQLEREALLDRLYRQVFEKKPK